MYGISLDEANKMITTIFADDKPYILAGAGEYTRETNDPNLNQCEYCGVFTEKKTGLCEHCGAPLKPVCN